MSGKALKDSPLPQKNKSLTKSEIEYIESAVLEGLDLVDIAHKLSLSKTALESIIKSEKVSKEVQVVTRYVTAKATNNLRIIADGFKQLVKSFKSNIDISKIKEHKNELANYLKSDEYEKFIFTLLNCDSLENQVAVEEKYYPPDRNANIKLLEVFNPELWDMEAKHKRIPATKIHLTIGSDEIGRRMDLDTVEYTEIVDDRNKNRPENT